MLNEQNWFRIDNQWNLSQDKNTLFDIELTKIRFDSV